MTTYNSAQVDDNFIRKVCTGITATGGGSAPPTTGQIWPRGNRGV